MPAWDSSSPLFSVANELPFGESDGLDGLDGLDGPDGPDGPDGFMICSALSCKLLANAEYSVFLLTDQLKSRRVPPLALLHGPEHRQTCNLDAQFPGLGLHRIQATFAAADSQTIPAGWMQTRAVPAPRFPPPHLWNSPKPTVPRPGVATQYITGIQKSA